MRSIRSIPVGASLTGGLALLALLAGGCGTEPQPTSVVCTDFRAGADLSQSTFGVTGDLQRSYVAFAQAAGDLSAVANGMLRDVGASCRGLAVALGADPQDPRAVGKLAPEAVRAWCKIAGEVFTSVRPRLASRHFAVQIITPRCNVDTAFQTECETKCKAVASCTEASPEDRCPEDAREGVCPGTCSGTCNGSETAPAQCAGTCSGTCFGTCDDGAESSDCSTGCVCTKTCKGDCTGGCELPVAGAHCNAPCAGRCSEPMLAPTCNKPLAPPTCVGDVDCQKSCSASSSARAVCPAGSLNVVIDEAARTDPALAQIVGALERTLPPIFLASQGRAKALADGASDLLDSAGHILSRGEALGPMGAACGIIIGETGSEARTNLSAALDGSKELARAVSGE